MLNAHPIIPVLGGTNRADDDDDDDDDNGLFGEGLFGEGVDEEGDGNRSGELSASGDDEINATAANAVEYGLFGEILDNENEDEDEGSMASGEKGRLTPGRASIRKGSVASLASKFEKK